MSGESERGKTTLDTFINLLKTDSYGQGIDYYVEQLREINEWAHGQQPVAVGDKVVINGVGGDRILSNSGWYGYRHCLEDGATGTVQRVGFYKPRGWYASVILDEEWVMVDDYSTRPKTQHRQDIRADRRGGFSIDMKHLTKYVAPPPPLPPPCDCCGRDWGDDSVEI